jgi:drug/metabolite transporter (DMT)-like permease
MILWQGLLSKIASESLLSLYPVFVKNIHLPLDIQMWSRFFTYIVISFFFIDYSYVKEHLFTKDGLSLMSVTILHVYSSYAGFQLLESGVAYTIFYIYPLLILLLSGKINLFFLFSSVITLFGIYLLTSSSSNTDIQEEKNMSENTPVTPENTLEKKEDPWYKGYAGYLWIGIAALTEALIYFIVKRLKTKNNWNHLFISYGFGSIVFTLYNLYTNKILETEWSQWRTLLSLFINSFIGLFGYLLRFYAISHLDTTIYAPLSYLGVVMAYLYGILLNGESITLLKIIGTIFILGPHLFRFA